jgi:hypothetical protein
VPSVILTFGRIAIFSFEQDDGIAYEAVLLTIPSWFLIAYLQYRLLRPISRRSRWWLIATFVGGNLGGFAEMRQRSRDSSRVRRVLRGRPRQ